MSDYNCYRCENEGWVINSLGIYTNCPICHNSKIIRIVKQNIFNLIVKLFKLSSDYLKKINWVSEETLHFQRLYNVELEGTIVEAEKPPFENYSEVFEKGNEVLKNKIAHKIISEYISGYTVERRLIVAALQALTGTEKLFELAKKTHDSALLGKDTSVSFYETLEQNLK